MKTKKCFKCNKIKSISNFYKHPGMKSGYLNKCKECNKKDVQENYRNNIDYYREYERNRASLPHRKEACRIYNKTHPEKIREIKKRWNKNNSDKIKLSRKKYKDHYPEKSKAHAILGNAIKYKHIFKKPCKFCGELKVEAHHADYSKPLDITWLCIKCHKDLHIKLRQEKIS